MNIELMHALQFIVGLGLLSCGVILGPFVNKKALDDPFMYFSSMIIAGIGGGMLFALYLGTLA